MQHAYNRGEKAVNKHRKESDKMSEWVGNPTPSTQPKRIKTMVKPISAKPKAKNMETSSNQEAHKSKKIIDILSEFF